MLSLWALASAGHQSSATALLVGVVTDAVGKGLGARMVASLEAVEREVVELGGVRLMSVVMEAVETDEMGMRQPQPFHFASWVVLSIRSR